MKQYKNRYPHKIIINFKAMSLRHYIHHVKTYVNKKPLNIEDIQIVGKIITFLIDHKYMTNNTSVFKALLKACLTYQDIVETHELSFQSQVQMIHESLLPWFKYLPWMDKEDSKLPINANNLDFLLRKIALEIVEYNNLFKHGY